MQRMVGIHNRRKVEGKHGLRQRQTGPVRGKEEEKKIVTEVYDLREVLTI